MDEEHNVSVVTPMQRGNQPQELISKKDCKAALAEAMNAIEAKMDVSNQNLMRSILKFADRESACQCQN